MEQAKSENTVTLEPEGYMLVKLVGKQDYMTMDTVARECKAMAAEMKMDGKPLIGLVDFTEDLGFTSGTNKAVLKALEEISYDRVAMFGTHPVLTEVTKAVILALGKGDRTKVFGTRDEALAWLLTVDPVHGY
jgi:hypothetical protein